MNVNEREQVEVNKLNVVSLFKEASESIIVTDPLVDLLAEAQVEDEVLTKAHVRNAKVVSEDQFPDQSMFTLEEQLQSLRSTLNRIKFYMGEMDDLIPR